MAEVFSGRDGGWPATQRGEGRLSLAESWRAGRWIALSGVLATAATYWLSPDLIWWLMPVTLPMIAAPVLIWLTSQPLTDAVFTVPDERAPSAVIAAYRRNLHAGTTTREAGDVPIRRYARSA